MTCTRSLWPIFGTSQELNSPNVSEAAPMQLGAAVCTMKLAQTAPKGVLNYAMDALSGGEEAQLGCWLVEFVAAKPLCCKVVVQCSYSRGASSGASSDASARFRSLALRLHA
eukprot:6197519-Pleurochrysis_carterae.AAC.1